MGYLTYKVCDGYVSGIFENGKEVKFDIEDLPKISNKRWFIDNRGYAGTCDSKNANIRMHRMLLEDIPDGMVIDHINRDKLDNRRQNLRICSQGENSRNSSAKSDSQSGVRGVFFDKRTKKWRAQIQVNRKTINIGQYEDFKDAVYARKDAEKKYWKC